MVSILWEAWERGAFHTRQRWNWSGPVRVLLITEERHGGGDHSTVVEGESRCQFRDDDGSSEAKRANRLSRCADNELTFHHFVEVVLRAGNVAKLLSTAASPLKSPTLSASV